MGMKSFLLLQLQSKLLQSCCFLQETAFPVTVQRWGASACGQTGTRAERPAEPSVGGDAAGIGKTVRRGIGVGTVKQTREDPLYCKTMYVLNACPVLFFMLQGSVLRCLVTVCSTSPPGGPVSSISQLWKGTPGQAELSQKFLKRDFLKVAGFTLSSWLNLLTLYPVDLCQLNLQNGWKSKAIAMYVRLTWL